MLTSSKPPQTTTRTSSTSSNVAQPATSEDLRIPQAPPDHNARLLDRTPHCGLRNALSVSRPLARPRSLSHLVALAMTSAPVSPSVWSPSQWAVTPPCGRSRTSAEGVSSEAIHGPASCRSSSEPQPPSVPHAPGSGCWPARAWSTSSLFSGAHASGSSQPPSSQPVGSNLQNHPPHFGFLTIRYIPKKRENVSLSEYAGWLLQKLESVPLRGNGASRRGPSV